MIDNTERIINTLKERFGTEKAERLLAYLDLVLERNEHINLTAVRDRDEALVKHVIDSLEVTGLPEYQQAHRVIDVGTGAGFPGALLAIVNPEKNFVLLDSTRKRLRVIDEFCQALDIANVTTLHARAEEINRKPPHGGAYDLCVSRAVADLSVLAGWCLPFVKSGGHFIAYKGENYAAELASARAVLRKQHALSEHVVSYKDVPEEIAGHVLLVFPRH